MKLIKTWNTKSYIAIEALVPSGMARSRAAHAKGILRWEPRRPGYESDQALSEHLNDLRLPDDIERIKTLLGGR